MQVCDAMYFSNPRCESRDFRALDWTKTSDLCSAMCVAENHLGILGDAMRFHCDLHSRSITAITIPRCGELRGGVQIFGGEHAKRLVSERGSAYVSKLSKCLLLVGGGTWEPIRGGGLQSLQLGWPATEWDTGPEPKVAEKRPAGKKGGAGKWPDS